MSVDEALLKWANETGAPTLRFYQWSQPTLSLGYFQKSADRALHRSSVDCPIVRRSSGGGAILHDHELTYSLSMPGTNRWSSKQNDLYGTVHAAIVNVLHGVGVKAGQFERSLQREGQTIGTDKASGINQRFLCFQRRTPGDIILQKYKIGGSAQRRLSNATLQHGSLLMRRSQYSPELPGIFDLADLKVSLDDITEGLVKTIGRSLNFGFKRMSLTKNQKKIAEEIWANKYDRPEWTGRR